jgi:hypothetical protein
MHIEAKVCAFRPEEKEGVDDEKYRIFIKKKKYGKNRNAAY